jgi:hypothetical protein
MPKAGTFMILGGEVAAGESLSGTSAASNSSDSATFRLVHHFINLNLASVVPW